MFLQKYAFASTVTGATAVLKLSEVPSERDEFHVQVNLSSTGTVAVQGRLHEDAPWTEVESITSDGLKVYSRFAQIRFNVTANAGTIDIFVAY